MPPPSKKDKGKGKDNATAKKRKRDEDDEGRYDLTAQSLVQQVTYNNMFHNTDLRILHRHGPKLYELMGPSSSFILAITK